MNYQHKQLASGRWENFSFFEQMSNIGSEVERAIKWKSKNDTNHFMPAFERALELFELTVADKKNKRRLKEILRVREALVDYFLYDDTYNTNANQWKKYFFYFNFACRVHGL